MSITATLSSQRIEAFNASVREPIQHVATGLRELLGAKLVAYIAGVSATRVTKEWAEGVRQPSPPTEIKLRYAFRIARMIEQSEGAAIVATWFQGMNPHLGDRSPARVLHEDDFEASAPKVLQAANAFVGASGRWKSRYTDTSRLISDQHASPIDPHHPAFRDALQLHGLHIST